MPLSTYFLGIKFNCVENAPLQLSGLYSLLELSAIDKMRGSRGFLRICKRTMATCMEPSKVKYKYVEDVERLVFYVPGGYHPVMLRDEFYSGRYKIADKLGFGSSATTWRAEDKHNNSRLVAVKISTAESANRSPELEILSQLTKAEQTSLERLSSRASSIRSDSPDRMRPIDV